MNILFALSTTMFVVDRHSVKNVIHMKDHTIGFCYLSTNFCPSSVKKN